MQKTLTFENSVYITKIVENLHHLLIAIPLYKDYMH